VPLQLHLFAGSSLVLGRASDSGRHAHRAAQLLLVLQGTVELQAGGAPRRVEAAVLAPQQVHRIRGEGQLIAHLFVDPGPRAWQAWIAAGGAPQPPDAGVRAALDALAADAGNRTRAEALARQWRQQVLPGLADGVIDDARIAAAVARIEADPSATGLDHRHLAQAVHLSPSRFITLFRAQTGMPVRNYVLWRRLLLAVQHLERGQTVTAAAHAAGFADAAHLSRSFRKVVGAAPSELRLG
jgi:AraC family transcriptional regulator